MTFQKMKTVLTNSHITIHTRKRTLECYIEPILMYGCEAWTISKQAQKKLEAVEMWFLRRMMKISWMAKKSNDTVLKEAHTSRALVNKIRTRQTTFFGHVMRREKLEHLITTGMMEGKRSRGKQREKMTDGLVKWLGAGKVVEILKATRDRGIWKDMIANAIKHGTGWWWTISAFNHDFLIPCGDEREFWNFQCPRDLFCFVSVVIPKFFGYLAPTAG